MNDKQITRITIISVMVSFLLITTGLSFAYFTANITGTETQTTINVTGGMMNIHYAGGDVIEAFNINPKNTPFATKTFTLTGNNTTSEDMEYHILLIVEENTFSENALSYKLISTNTDNNGEVVPSITVLKGIPTGDNQEIILGNAHFTSPTEGSKVHTYNLELYFPDTGVPQDEDQGKIFNAYVDVREGNLLFGSFAKMLLSQYGGQDDIIEAPLELFSYVNADDESAMYKMEDDYGMSYYFRGAKEYVNNNLIFAEHQWKIVRINGNGSIRIIYNGTCLDNDCTINSIGDDTQILKTAFNTNIDDNKYVGYMYGNSSTSKETAHANEIDSNIKTVLDDWYINNILGKGYEQYLFDTLFCNDRGIHSGDGFGENETYYSSYNRLQTNKSPILKCENSKDRFTVLDNKIANAALQYPIGLLTSDEAAVSGLLHGTSTSTNYLYTGEYYWLLSPARFSDYAYNWAEYTNGRLSNNNNVSYSRGVRPVLNLNSHVEVTGTGTLLDPYIVL